MIGELTVILQALIMDYISLKIFHCVIVFTVKIHNHDLI